MIYKVVITETLEKIVEIEAESEEEAEQKVQDSYNDQEIVLDSENVTVITFEIYED